MPSVDPPPDDWPAHKGGRHIAGSAHAIIAAPLERVWASLAQDFAEIGRWSSGVKRSVPLTDQSKRVDAAPVAGRFCEIAAAGFSDTHERIVSFKPMQEFSYELYKGLPGFVAGAVNTWRFSPVSDGTRLEGRTDMIVTGLMGTLMGGMMRGSLNAALASMAGEAKYLLETGALHPNKLRLMRKLKQPLPA